VSRHFEGPEPSRVEQDVQAALQKFTDLALVTREAVL
jgi:hypothetical protein